MKVQTKLPILNRELEVAKCKKGGERENRKVGRGESIGIGNRIQS
jgi:hypothetical protein